jgi:hypothetical protein
VKCGDFECACKAVSMYIIEVDVKVGRCGMWCGVSRDYIAMHVILVRRMG